MVALQLLLLSLPVTAPKMPAMVVTPIKMMATKATKGTMTFSLMSFFIRSLTFLPEP
ncbi:TPA: hypothetical protein ACGL4V_000085 [Streptococcus agalactiae]|uniref:hypothetical protein n=1 Tax=Streptococcus agalactiae TaxID=1311 RepID=UPI003753CF83